MVIGVLVVAMLPGERRFTLPLQSAPGECTDHMMPKQSSSLWTGLLFRVTQPLPVERTERKRKRVRGRERPLGTAVTR